MDRSGQSFRVIQQNAVMWLKFHPWLDPAGSERPDGSCLIWATSSRSGATCASRCAAVSAVIWVFLQMTGSLNFLVVRGVQSENELWDDNPLWGSSAADHLVRHTSSHIMRSLVQQILKASNCLQCPDLHWSDPPPDWSLWPSSLTTRRFYCCFWSSL